LDGASSAAEKLTAFLLVLMALVLVWSSLLYDLAGDAGGVSSTASATTPVGDDGPSSDAVGGVTIVVAITGLVSISALILDKRRVDGRVIVSGGSDGRSSVVGGDDLMAVLIIGLGSISILRLDMRCVDGGVVVPGGNDGPSSTAEGDDMVAVLVIGLVSIAILKLDKR